MFKKNIVAYLVFVLLTSFSNFSYAQQVEKSGNTYHVRACPKVTVPGFVSCHARAVTDNLGRYLRHDAYGRKNAAPTLSNGTLTPSDLQSAYGLPSNGGLGTTVIAIIDVYAYPTAYKDLNIYRSAYNLPNILNNPNSGFVQSSTGKFLTGAKINNPLSSVNPTCNGNSPCFTSITIQNSSSPTAVNSGWDQEQALDIEMVSAICPNCSILLIQAASASFTDIYKAVSYAESLGAKIISNSYGGSDSTTTSNYNRTDTIYTVSSGDAGYGVEFPASLNSVVAVGGTSLTKISVGSGRGWNETVWSGAGSGCSAYNSRSPWQQAALNSAPTATTCTKRIVADVSAVADPNTGVAVYWNGGWYKFGGTSVAAPIIAGVFGVSHTNTGTNLSTNFFSTSPGGVSSVVYNLTSSNGISSAAKGQSTNINDVVSGSNSTSCSSTNLLCHGEPGYDGPTGVGTPNGASSNFKSY